MSMKYWKEKFYIFNIKKVYVGYKNHLKMLYSLKGKCNKRFISNYLSVLISKYHFLIEKKHKIRLIIEIYLYLPSNKIFYY